MGNQWPRWLTYLAKRLRVSPEDFKERSEITNRQIAKIPGGEIVSEESVSFYELASDAVKLAVEDATKEMAAAITNLEADVKEAQAIAQEHYRCRMEAEAKLRQGPQAGLSVVEQCRAILTAEGYKRVIVPFGVEWRKEVRMDIDGTLVRATHDIFEPDDLQFFCGASGLRLMVENADQEITRKLVRAAVAEKTARLQRRIDEINRSYDRVSVELLSLKERIREVVR